MVIFCLWKSNLINLSNLTHLCLWKTGYTPHILLIYLELQRDIHKEIIRNQNQARIKKDWYLFLASDFAGGLFFSSVSLSESTCLRWISMVPGTSPGNSMLPAYPMSLSPTSSWDAYLSIGAGSTTKSCSWEWLSDTNAAIASLRLPNPHHYPQLPHGMHTHQLVEEARPNLVLENNYQTQMPLRSLRLLNALLSTLSIYLFLLFNHSKNIKNLYSGLANVPI